MPKKERKEKLKLLLGDYGVSIILSIGKGARTFETIKLISGVPLSCIHGRIPVLIELGLIEKQDNGYRLTKKGMDFKRKLEKDHENF